MIWFGAKPGLGRDKGLLVSRQSFPRVVLRHGVFMSRPKEQDCVRDGVLGARTMDLGMHMSARTNDSVAHTTEPLAHIAHATMSTMQARQRAVGTRLCARQGFCLDRNFSVTTDLLSSQQCTVVTPRPEGPIDHRQPAENMCVSFHEIHT